MLTAAIMALFLVDATFLWQYVKQLDKPKESGFSDRRTSRGALDSKFEFPDSAVDPHKVHTA